MLVAVTTMYMPLSIGTLGRRAPTLDQSESEACSITLGKLLLVDWIQTFEHFFETCPPRIEVDLFFVKMPRKQYLQA